MKTVFIGDIHGRNIWKKIVEKEKDAIRFVFIGDYFDSFDIPAVVQMSNFIDIMEFYNSQLDINKDKEIICLIGNHDFHYFSKIGYNGTSGYQSGAKFEIEELINEYRYNLQIAYQFDNILCTHAGLSEEFIEMTFPKYGIETSLETENLTKHLCDSLIHIWNTDKREFQFNGVDGYGNNTWQTPIWIRPQSLMQASECIKDKGITQIVGHTAVKEISTDKRLKGYFFIDALGVQEYLVYEDGNFSVSKI